jgi:DNA topoisomerase-1
MSNASKTIYRDTISRKNGKPKFQYIYAGSNRVLSGKALEKIEKIYVPHSWDEVEIYIGHPKLVATGILKDIIRYQYHKEFTDKKSKEKYRRMYSFGRKMPHIKDTIVDELTSHNATKNKVLATALWILTKSYIRVGNEKYLRENNTHGLLTLQKRHIRFYKDDMYLDFVGKKKVRGQYTVHIGQGSFKRWLKRMHAEADPFFFQFKGKRIMSNDLNAFIQERFGKQFTAKDFRTWGANIEFLKQVRKLKSEELTCKRDCQKSLKNCISNVSEKLNNTIAVCKSNYICKAILEEFRKEPQHFLGMVRQSKSDSSLLLKLLKKLT